MPPIIKILPGHVINRIAAGEVVERPSSVVKELVENAIDASATEITVDVEQAGRRLIRVTDNGSGMTAEDAGIAFERHATSKITSDADLEAIHTMGFRGEALSSIASVARVRMKTSTGGQLSGTLIEIDGGAVRTAAETAAPRGTSLEVAHLFYNTPARLKFLKSPATEFSHIVTALSRLATAHTSIRFKLTHNGKTVLDLPASRSLRERVFQLYGSDIAENLADFSDNSGGVLVSGLIGRPGYSRGDKTYQDFYVNQRAVRNAGLSHALYSACGDMLMRDRHPVCFAFLSIDPSLVDVNVHPAKTEVRFRNQSQIHDLVRDVIREGLRAAGASRIPSNITAVKEAVSHYIDKAVPEMSGSGSMPDFFPPPEHGPATVKSVSSASQVSFAGLSGATLAAPSCEILFPVAQIHDSFIIAQSREGMAIVDQHAAHERVLFERLQDQAGSGKFDQQNLLIPVQVEPGPARSALLADHLADIAAMGLAVEDFGNGVFIIKAVPSLLAGGDYRRLLLDILDEITVHGKSRKLDEARDRILSVMACHPAIKVHRKLDIREMQTLLRDLSLCRMPHTCPHGRPTAVNISLDDMKKMFRRK